MEEKTKSPYLATVEKNFVEACEKRAEMEKDFHPSMIGEYGEIEKKIVSYAVKLLEAGAEYTEDEKTVSIYANDKSFSVEKGKILEAVGKEEYAALLPVKEKEEKEENGNYTLDESDSDAKELAENGNAENPMDILSGYVHMQPGMRVDPLTAAVAAALLSKGMPADEPPEAKEHREEIAMLRDKNDKLIEEQTNYRVQIGVLEEKLESAKAIFSEKEKMFTEFKNSVSEKEASFASRLKAAEADVRGSDEVKKRLSEALFTAEKLRNDLVSMTGERDSIAKKAADAAAALEARQAELNRARADAESFKKQLQRQGDEMKRAVADAAAKAKAEAEKQAAANAARDAQRNDGRRSADTAKIADLEKQLSDAKSQNDALKKQIQDLQDKLKSAQDEVKKASDELAAAKKNAADPKELSSVKAELSNVQSELSSANDRLSKERAEKEKIGKDLIDANTKISSLEGELEAAKKKADSIDADMKLAASQTEQIEGLAYTDWKTKLGNTNAFNRDFQTKELSGTSLAYVVVSGLFDINIQYGRTAGDRVVKEVADALKEKFGDNTYRGVGAQFVVISDHGYDKTVSELDSIKDELYDDSIDIVYGIADGNKYSGRQEFIDATQKSLEDAMRENLKNNADTSENGSSGNGVTPEPHAEDLSATSTMSHKVPSVNVDEGADESHFGNDDDSDDDPDFGLDGAIGDYLG
jgi:GGDEF domain-containing protein